MSYRIEQHPQTGQPEIVIDGWEYGVAQSPHKGIANIQAGNIATETGEVMCSFNRVKQSQTGTSGSLTQVNTNTVSISGITLLVGQFITITNAGTTGLSGNYYYLSTGKLWSGSEPPDDPDNATATTGISAGTATFSITYPMTEPRESAIETYTDNNGNSQARYYILTANGNIWRHDSKTLGNWDTPLWQWMGDVASGSSGLCVYKGWLMVWQTSNSGTAKLTYYPTFASSKYGAGLGNPSLAPIHHGKHTTLSSLDGKLYVIDGAFLASFFADTSSYTGGINIQSQCEYSVDTTTHLSQVYQINGTLPTLGYGSAIRVPVYFYTTDTLPTAITADTIYYLETEASGNSLYFQAYTAATGGSALNMTTGAVGKQFFNTFSPSKTASFAFSPQRLNLPSTELAQCIAELGNTIIIGGKLNLLYPWDKVSAIPSDIIPLPENDVKQLVTVNNVLYVFAGSKGNIYITNGSSAAHALSVPDYCAGIAGTPNSYIEPYFNWGDAMYLRGRVYFSIQDETATKAGNCGGIWSFIPTQNFFLGQDTGQSLRLENQSSYGTYSGYCPVLIPNVHDQDAVAPQYWSAWISGLSSPTYGIDGTDTIPQICKVETDLIPAGTMLNQKTFSQIEYKLATPLVVGDSVLLAYRENAIAAWTSCGTVITESTTSLSGYIPVNFQKGQWLQLQATLTPLGTTASSFIRLRELRIR